MGKTDFTLTLDGAEWTRKEAQQLVVNLLKLLYPPDELQLCEHCQLKYRGGECTTCLRRDTSRELSDKWERYSDY